MQTYSQQLQQIEMTIAQAKTAQKQAPQDDEQAKLEAELASLDEEMKELDAIEKQQQEDLRQLEQYGTTIQSEAKGFWTKFNEYEK